MARQIITFVFFGEKYLEQFKICDQTIPENWQVAVITDQEYQHSRHDIIKVATPPSVFDMLTYRQYLDFYIDVESFDQIWYADMDMLFKDDILEKYKDSRDILVSNEPLTTMANEHMNGGMSDEEVNMLISSNAPAINGGLYMVPIGQYEFFHKYRQMVIENIRERPNITATDQHVLNQMYHRKLFQMRLFDKGDVDFPGMAGSYGKYVNHYIGIGREKVEWMKSELSKI